MVPIFDSLSHPTLSSRWLGKDVDASFATLANQLSSSGFAGACAIGMAGIEDYNHEDFIAQCKKYELLVPIAGVGLKSQLSLLEELDLVRELGFRGVKIHPRFSKLTRQLDSLGELFAEAAKRELVVFYCTYMHCDSQNYPLGDPFYSLAKLISDSPATRVVLVHGGDVSLLKYAELARFNDNLILDLSLTLMKYKGSSIDLDIRFLFEKFDRKICIGTDHPEYTHAEVRERFEFFSNKLPTDKKENAGYLNLQRFMGIT